VVTLAGLGTPEKPHPIQKAYVEEEVPQCGYCINGLAHERQQPSSTATRSRPMPRSRTPSPASSAAVEPTWASCAAVKRASEMMG